MGKKKPVARHEVWLIEWFDAHDAPSEWVEPSAMAVDRRLVQSVGFRVESGSDSDSDHVLLVTSDDGANHLSNGIFIPKVNIHRQCRLK